MSARSAGRLALAALLAWTSLGIALAQSPAPPASGYRAHGPEPRRAATPPSSNVDRHPNPKPHPQHGTYGGVRPYVVIDPRYVNGVLSAKPTPTPKTKHTPHLGPEVFSHYDNRAQ